MARPCIAVLLCALTLSLLTLFFINLGTTHLPQLDAVRHPQAYVQEPEAPEARVLLTRNGTATNPAKKAVKRASSTYLLGVGKADLTG